MKLFEKNSTVYIYIAEKSEPIEIAANDLRLNLERLSDCTSSFLFSENPEKAGIYISLCNDANVVKNEPEAFAVNISDDGVFIYGYDELGVIFGIYHFCTEVLKIDPMYRMTGVFLNSVLELNIENATYSEGTPKCRFRGWFLNDEDLLTDFKPWEGTRNIDYPFYKNVIRPDVLDMVLETALRCRINLVIPSSFINIDNPYEEKLVETVCRRGLYVSQHHVEPMGVSYFSASEFIRKNNIGSDVSFVKNPEVMRQIWTYYAKKWKKYAKNTIWQLGLRGKADEAVWKSDKNVPDDEEKRGKIISDAISVQYKIIEDVLGTDNFISTSTLWMEGAELYGKGYLSMPPKTIVVFSDIGDNQMFGDDFYKAARYGGMKYGIYYHVAYWGNGPHLAEGCSPEKIDFSLSEAARKNSLYYCITNVSNVRPLHFSAALNAALLCTDTDAASFTEKYYNAIFGDFCGVVTEGMKRYYMCFADFGQDELVKRCEKHNFYYHDYGVTPFINYEGSDGKLRNGSLNSYENETLMRALKNSAERFDALYKYWLDNDSKVPAAAREYYDIYQKFQTRYMFLLTMWNIAYNEMFLARSAEGVMKKEVEAQDCLKQILCERKILERGCWQGWLNGEKKLDFEKLREITHQKADEQAKKHIITGKSVN